MDPRGAAEHDKRMEQLRRLRERLGCLPLSKFKVNELPALLRMVEGDMRCGDYELLKDKHRPG